ncbi:hypothetical protein SAMN04488057_11056 [Cyclobacterium lianum]|uniref:Uncharacterized protein n=1 Tax=Cyclobacterium lianum TaxID=388280 RepID=A0A1M7PRF6_9BACT|nr:hypothetical protein [Cyclobacterium lianum]SHN19979.1 hypothetical protein SAMN04488057_11056 [Cyclobacterium lianum]
MKNIGTFRFRPMYWSLLLLILANCEKFDDLPDPVLNRYDVPAEVLGRVFTADVPQNIRNVDEFFDRIKAQGMVIHEGNEPPVIYNRNNQSGPGFTIGNHCLYDSRNRDNEGFTYGKYQETIRIYPDRNQSIFLADIAYFSVSDPDFPEFPRGLDSGSGMGYVSGNQGSNFTIFIKITNGKYDLVDYSAIWIISGTYVEITGGQNELTDVTKCMIMLEKSEDLQDRVADRGTIRIFRDDAPERLP